MIALIAPDRAAVDAVARAGRPALAWEVLRRDPAYRAAYRSLAAAGEAGVAAETGFTADWGCTFAEDPGLSCAHVTPLWSAAVDPCVLPVRAVPGTTKTGRRFDASSVMANAVGADGVEHLVVGRRGQHVRLDVVEGSTRAGPVLLQFLLADDDRLGDRLAVIRSWHAPLPAVPNHRRWSRTLLALDAVDTHQAGASLRETADLLMGPGDWPGDGEHRKSRVRRLLAAGRAAIRNGPRAILAMGGL